MEKDTRSDELQKKKNTVEATSLAVYEDNKNIPTVVTWVISKTCKDSGAEYSFFVLGNVPSF